MVKALHNAPDNPLFQRVFLYIFLVKRILTGIDQAIFKNHIQYANSILDSVGEGSLLTPEESDVLTAVQQLPLKYRSVIHLFYIEGYSISEIGSILGLKVSTVGSQLARAMLRSRLKEGFDE
ncbi:MAG TPA: hypothetical protein GX017_08340 [Clostridiales bacterium]|nr:hypothetical protein [Clostridiales bacterium]